MVTLYVTCGIAGSGKSTISSKLRDEFGLKLYCFDSLRKGCKFEDRQKIYDRLYADIKDDMLNNHSVIYDDLNITSKRRLELLLSIQDVQCRKILIVMTTPLEECIRRNAERQIGRLPDSVIYHLNSQYEPPSLEEGWDEILYY